MAVSLQPRASRADQFFQCIFHILRQIGIFAQHQAFILGYKHLFDDFFRCTPGTVKPLYTDCLIETLG